MGACWVMISVHVQVPLQGLAPVLPGSTSLAQPLDAVLSIACSFASPWMSLEPPPLQYMLFPPAGVFGPEALRKGSWVSQSGRQKLLLRNWMKRSYCGAS